MMITSKLSENRSPHFIFTKIWARNMSSLFGPITMCYFRHCEIFFGINVIC